METTKHVINEETPLSGPSGEKIDYRKWAVFLIFVAIIFTQIFDVDVNLKANIAQERTNLEEKVLPLDGIVLPVRWGDLGRQLVEKGVIDRDEFEALYAQSGGLDAQAQNLLYGENNSALEINAQNSGVILNLLWAFGLANKNPILDEGPMWDAQYGGDAGYFASTGGWTLAKGDAMDHYSHYPFVVLTPQQQELIERVSRNIYRPCCGNSTYFPDCNHGMAMLGLLELLAAQGASEEDMYRMALQVNSYWFPDTYLTIAKYFAERGVAWKDINAKDVLGPGYSSAAGYQQILDEVESVQFRGGSSCGI